MKPRKKKPAARRPRLGGLAGHIAAQRAALKATRTVVTNVAGEKRVESEGTVVSTPSSSQTSSSSAISSSVASSTSSVSSSAIGLARDTDELGCALWYASCLAGSTVRAARPGAGTGFVYSDKMLAHRGPAQHPERPERLESIRASLLAAGHLECVVTIPPRPATPLELLAVHTAEHVEHIEQTAGWFAAEQQSSNLVSGLAQKLGYIQRGDIYYSQQTAACALLSCGSAVEVTLRVLRGELRNAFALIRPPGHHAEANKEMGFCFYNNAAVAARTALMYGARRILILDWDVHHGNGTEHIFEATDEVMYISLHRFGAGFYPMTGAASDTGKGPGEGYSVNIPWPETETGDIDYEVAFERLVMPIAEAYGADLVIVSAGFDAAVGDPIGGMCVTPACYAYMTERLCTLAGGKVVMLLEGGYNLDSIAASATACVGTLLGSDSDQERGTGDGVGDAGTVRRCKDTTAPLLDRQVRRFARYWDILNE